MPDDPYSLSDLANLADVTPRTVRYYIAQGLLPSPDAAGRATRYGAGHLLRLRLIRRLQRDHLPLAEIRFRLERMGDAEVEAALDAAGLAPVEQPMSTDETLAYVHALMQKAGVAPRFYDRPAPEAAPASRESAATYVRTVPDEFPMRDAPAPATAPAPALAAPPMTAPLPLLVPSMPSSASRSSVGDRSTWERLSITPDVEIHVRRPLDRHTNKRVEQLARIARELFEDEA